MLDERHIGLDQARLALVVTQAGAGIERPNVVQGLLHRFREAPDGARDFFVLLVLQSAQMLVHDGNRVGQHLRGGLSVSILVRGQLRLVVAQLIEQTIAQVAAGDSRRIHLAHQIERFMQIIEL